MQRNDLFSIDLLDARLTESAFDYDLDDGFFQKIEGLIDRGHVRVHVEVKQQSKAAWNLTVHSEGNVIVPCDRCLADLELRINTTDMLRVQLGEDYDDDGEVITVPANDGRLDLSIPIYELIVLSMPLSRVHEPGNCDPDMMRLISEHQSARSGEDMEDEQSDGLA